MSARVGQGATCNTPPQITCGFNPVKKNQIVIDWLECTLPLDFGVLRRYESLKTYLKYENAIFVPAERGLHGYKKQIRYGKSKILLDGTDEMGVHLILSGEAIREIRGDFHAFIHFLVHQGAKFTRVDVAYDDFTETVTVQKAVKVLDSGSATSRFKSYKYIRGGSISQGQNLGETVYIGSPKSRVMVRIYDKAMERVSAFAGEFVGPLYPWTRIEVQIRKENAHLFVVQLHESAFDVGKLTRDLLNNYIQFREKNDDDSNKSRWSLCDWWQLLLDTTEKLSLTIQKAEPSLERMKKWFVTQVAPTFATLLNAYGSESMKNIYLLGKARMSPQQRQLASIPF